MICKVWSGDFDNQYEIFETNAPKELIIEAFKTQVKTEENGDKIIAGYEVIENKGYFYNILQSQDDDEEEIEYELLIDLYEMYS